MPALNTPDCNFGAPAINYQLPDAHGKVWSLDDCKGPNGLLVMFICNHCPYVKAIIEELVKTTRNLKEQGVNTVAIMSNDWQSYPEDSPQKMQEFQNKFNFDFPYLVDETQEIAKKYGAVCTPDFFGYNKDLKLQYRGRFDSRGRDANIPLQGDNNLEQAMLLIAATGLGPTLQHASIGCSIKWRDS